MPSLYRPPPTFADASAADAGLLDAVTAGAARLTPAQGLELFHRMPLVELGRLADARCRAIHGDAIRTYVIDRNINYTNVCTAKCTFCAFRRDAEDHDAYTLEHGRLYEKIEELVGIGGTQVLMQGGMNPALPLEWYTTLLRGIKERFAGANGGRGVHVHGFSPPEFIEFVRFFDPPGATLFDKVLSVIRPLREAGLDSVPGGGGEIFAAPVRRKIGLGKCDAESWLTVMKAAHSLGMFTSATMMFGHIEGYADRVHHMATVREWQDRAMRDGGSEGGPGGHYKAFISWPFQRENTPLGRVRDWGDRPEELEPGALFPGDAVATLDGDGDARSHPEFGRRVRRAGAVEYLRTQAISRLMLDNVYSIGASWVTMGPHIGQVALSFGANDMGSVMMEENVVSAAGTTYCLNEPVLCRLIREAGFTPAQRDNAYDLLRVHDASRAGEAGYCPDLAVTDWSAHRAKRLHAERPAAGEAAPVQVTVTAGAK